jgi:tellurite resistance protein
MNLKEIFRTKTENKKRSHLKNLVAISKLDGKITAEELTFLINVGKKVGVSETEINEMIKRTSKIEVYKPETLELTLDYIYDLALMASVDGIIDENEIDLTIKIAEKLGLNPVTSGVIVRQIFILVEKKKSKEIIFETLKSHLLY